MITNLNDLDLASKIVEGIKIANRKMVEIAAANNKSLIIGDKDGGFKAIPAKELIKKLPK